MEQITLDNVNAKYDEFCASTDKYDEKILDLDPDTMKEVLYLSTLGNGLTSEAGEVADKIKKLVRDGVKDGYNLALAKELGDVLWYVSRMAQYLGYSLTDILKLNVNKLIKRVETQTLHGSGDDREHSCKDGKCEFSKTYKVPQSAFAYSLTQEPEMIVPVESDQG